MFVSPMFKSVYRVSTQSPVVPAAEIDALRQRLKIPLPIGYREYVTTLGDGELCDLLRVNVPQKVAPEHPDIRATLAEALREGNLESDRLSEDDLEESISFATSSNADFYVCCPRFGSDLFEIPRLFGTITHLPGGFVDAVNLSVERENHDFPFFESRSNTCRRLRCFDVKPRIGLDGFIARIEYQWGEFGLLRSPKGEDELYPSLFIRPIEARFSVYLDNDHTRLPGDCFHVVASYDISNEGEVASFVESVLMPGGRSTVK